MEAERVNHKDKVVFTLLIVFSVLLAAIVGSVVVLSAQNANGNLTQPKSPCKEGWFITYGDKCIKPEDWPLYNTTSRVVWNDIFDEVKVTQISFSQTYNKTRVSFLPPINYSFYYPSLYQKSVDSFTVDGNLPVQSLRVGQPVTLHYQLTYQELSYYAQNGTLIQQFCNNDQGLCYYPTFNVVGYSPP